MKHKVYGLTYAYIEGLDDTYKSKDSKYFLELTFRYKEVKLPFNSHLHIVFTRSFISDQLAWAKSVFAQSNIENGDKVAIIYDVINGDILAIGRNGFDSWITLPHLSTKPFAHLGIKNNSLIPMFY